MRGGVYISPGRAMSASLLVTGLESMEMGSRACGLLGNLKGMKFEEMVRVALEREGGGRKCVRDVC